MLTKQIDKDKESFQLSVDTLNALHKKKIEELVAIQKTELEHLKAENNYVNKLEKSESSRIFDEHKNNVFMAEREDAEGSENTTELNVPYRKFSKVLTLPTKNSIPLEDLLNSTSEFSFTYDEDLDFESLNSKLVDHESHIKHLMSLLSETEQDLAKINQQNSLLKEEIRKYERTDERAKHMHNLEYLKNVVVKVS